MRALTDDEIEEIIEIAYSSSEKYILNRVNKKDFENIDITINLNPEPEGFDIDINIELDTDMDLPENLAQEAIEVSLEAVDKYVDSIR